MCENSNTFGNENDFFYVYGIKIAETDDLLIEINYYPTKFPF